MVLKTPLFPLLEVDVAWLPLPVPVASDPERVDPGVRGMAGLMYPIRVLIAASGLLYIGEAGVWRSRASVETMLLGTYANARVVTYPNACVVSRGTRLFMVT
jgi:hypothetical protein